MNTIISPSILSANFTNLQADIEMLNSSTAEWIHVDVMDGVFVPNISFGLPILTAVSKITKKYLDVHLMIANADPYIEDFKKAGANGLTVHYEACPHLHRTIQAIKAAGMDAGVALNPHTPVSILKDIIQDLDLVLIMSVNPGFGGQKFIEHTYEKVKEVLDLSEGKCKIEVDGGVNTENAPKLIAAGAHVLVAGNAVFKSDDPLATIKKLSQA